MNPPCAQCGQPEYDHEGVRLTDCSGYVPPSVAEHPPYLSDDLNLQHLLAYIHCDGGQYAIKHGTYKATRDAIDDISRLHRECAQLRDAFNARLDEDKTSILSDLAKACTERDQLAAMLDECMELRHEKATDSLKWEKKWSSKLAAERMAHFGSVLAWALKMNWMEEEWNLLLDRLDECDRELKEVRGSHFGSMFASITRESQLLAGIKMNKELIKELVFDQDGECRWCLCQNIHSDNCRYIKMLKKYIHE